MIITEAQIKEYGERFFPHFTSQFQRLAIIEILKAHLTRI